MRRLLIIGGLLMTVSVFTAPAAPPRSVSSGVVVAASSGKIAHVVWVVMENHGYGSIIGSSQAPYVNQLANAYGLATNYLAIAHPSLPNYVALTSGSPQGVSDDNGPSSHPLNVPSIFSQLPGGQSRSLSESMPSNCLKSDSGEYVVHHNPMAYYTNLGSDCGSFDVPFGASPDLSAAFTFITPNGLHDMLDGTIAQGDSFLSSYVPALMATPQYQAGNTAIFITWDEDENTGKNNQVATIVVSPYTKAVKVSTVFNHYSLLRTAEDLLGLPALGNAASAAPMESAFGLTGSPPPPPSPPSNTALPVISGTAQQGQKLSTSNGSWTNSPTAFAYQWLDCDASGASCASISGATTSSYTLVSGDVGHTIRVVVTASNAGGSGVATSAQTVTVAASVATPPSNTALPAISGSTQQGQTLTTSTGTWTGTAPLSFAYAWADCDASGNNCTAISGATGSSYTLQAPDLGHTIRSTVTASNAGGSASATSAQSGVVVAVAHDPVVVAVGDIACAPGDTSNSCEQSLTANLASAQHPDAVLPLGDNQYNSGLLSEYTGAGAYGATWGIFNSIAHPAPGNHEYTASSTAAGYFGYFGAAVGGSTPSAPYYSYNLGAWHIVSLDSSCSDSGCGDVVAGETSAAQMAWLQSDLAAHPAACTLAYWHHPRFSASWTNDSPGTGPLFSALYNAHADVVVSGHDHVYERYAQQNPTGGATTSGVREFVSGTGGESLFTQVTTPANLQVFDQNDFGVLVLTLHATSYDWAFKRLGGTVVDSGTTACHGSGTGTASALAARDARAWPVGPVGPALAFDARLQPATVTRAERTGLSVAIHLTRAADVAVTVSLRRGRHLTRISSFYETETQIPRPHSRIRLRLPARRLKGHGSVTLVVRFAAVDAAGHHRTITRSVVLKRR